MFSPFSSSASTEPGREPEKSADEVEFAHGKEPEDGMDTQFEALIQEVVYSQPKESKTSL